MKIILFVALLISLCLAQAPVKPLWPAAASTSIFVENFERRETRHFLRYMYDQTQGKERIDGPREWLGEWYWTVTILNTQTKREYFIIYQEDLVECYDRPSNYTIPKPNFDNLRYVGKAEIDLVVADHWMERSPSGRDVLSFFDNANDHYLMRTDFDDERRGHVVIFRFHEWNAHSQDPNLFMVPANILPICNAIP